MGTNDLSTSGTFSYTITYSGDSTTGTSDCTYNETTWTIRIPQPRWLMVKIPRHWKRSKIDRFAGLVNEETHTGWRILALVHVKKVYDKSVERLTMEQFKMLLLQTAREADASKIEQFFARS
jgi:hypothetical protein